MRRVDAVFLLVVLGAAVAGGATLFAFSETLATQELIPVLQDNVAVEVTDVSVADRSVAVTVRFRNPTGSALTVNGGYFAVYRNGSRLAYGTASLSPPLTVGPRQSASATFELRLSPTQAESVQSAVEAGGFELQNQYGVTVADSEFTLRHDRVRVPAEGAS